MPGVLQRFFRVLPEETGKLARFALFVALLQAGVALGMTAADSLFLTNLGARKLPVIYVGMPVLMILYAPVYSVLLLRLRIDGLVRMTLAFLVVGGAALGVSAVVFGEARPWLLYAMKFYSGLWFIALYTLFWNFTDDYFSILDGKRLYGIIAAAGAAGASLGAALVGWLAGFVSPGRMFFLWAAIAAATFLAFASLRRRAVRVEVDASVDVVRPGLSRVLADVVKTFRGSRFAVSLAAICFGGVVLVTTLEYLSLGVLSQDKDPVQLARLLGRLYASANLLTMLLSLLAYNRIVARMGVGNTALVLPIAYLGAFAALFLEYGFGAALVAVYVYQSLLAAIEYNNVNLLFNAIPAAEKRPLRTFVEGLAEPLATAFAGGLLLLWAARLGAPNIALGGLCATVAVLVVATYLRHDYAGALADHLRREWLDFSPPPEHWRKCLGEADRVLLRDRAETSPNREERIAATDLLGYTADPRAADLLAQLLSSANAAECERLRPAIHRALYAGDAATVARLLLWLESPEGPEQPELLDEFAAAGVLPVRQGASWSRSFDPPRVAMAAVSRWQGSRLEGAESALRAVRGLLAGGTAEQRWGARAVGAFRQTQHAAELMRLLDDPEPALRQEVLRALHRVANPDTLDLLPRLMPLLDDAGPEERSLILGVIEKVGVAAPVGPLLLAAREFTVAESRRVESVIAGFGPRAMASVIHVLRQPTASSGSRMVAARTLSRLAPAQLSLIADELMSTEVERARESLATARALGAERDSDVGDGIVVLRRLYRDSAADTVDFVVQLLGLTGRLAEVDLVLASLSFGSPKDHANAIEAVEQSCSHALFARMQPLLTGGQRDAPPSLAAALPRATVLRRASTSEHALECAAALLALRDANDQAAHELARQSIDRSDSPATTRLLAALLPYLRPVYAMGNGQPLHPVEKIAALARSAYFSSARMAALEHLGKRADEHHFTDGAILFTPSDASANLYVVADGAVDVIRDGASHTLQRGGTCNERSLLGTSAPAEEAVSRGATVVGIPAPILQRAIEIFPALGIGLYRTKIVPLASS